FTVNSSKHGQGLAVLENWRCSRHPEPLPILPDNLPRNRRSDKPCLTSASEACAAHRSDRFRCPEFSRLYWRLAAPVNYYRASHSSGVSPAAASAASRLKLNTPVLRSLRE